MNQKFYCEYCKYTTTKHSNFNRHLKSKKHIARFKKTPNNSQQLPTLPKTLKNRQNLVSLKCQFCGNIFSRSCNRSKHEKTCVMRKKDEVEKDIKIKELEFQNRTYVGIIENLKEEKDRLIKLLTLNTSKPTNITNNYNYISTNYKDAYELFASHNYYLLFNQDKINQDAIPGQIEDNETMKNINNEQFVGNIISYLRLNTLEDLLGNFLIKVYLKKDKSKQSLHVTDCSRTKFVYAELAKGLNKIKWKTDFKGINIGRIIVDPLLDFVRDEVEKYQKSLIKLIKEKKGKVSDTVQDHLMQSDILLDMLDHTNKKKRDFDLKRKIIEYIAPHFELGRDYLLAN